jgi:hypothetical protein
MSEKRARDPRDHGVAVSSISITRRVEQRTLSTEEVGTDQDSDAWFEAYIRVDCIDDYTWGVCSLPARAAAGQGKASKDDGALCAYGEVGVQGEAVALPPGVKPCGLSRARRQGIATLRGRNPSWGTATSETECERRGLVLEHKHDWRGPWAVKSVSCRRRSLSLGVII